MTASHDTRHDWDYCHNPMHNDVEGDCPTCGGYLMGCPDLHDSLPDDAPGKEVTPAAAPTPHAAAGTRPAGDPSPSRRPVNPLDRVTWDLPFTAETEIPTDDTQPHTVTLRLTEAAGRQHARDLTRKHMADLVLLSRLSQQVSGPNHSDDAVTAYFEVLYRLGSALQSMATTEWTLTTEQAEDLAEQLTDAATEPPTCDVGTCTGYAVTPGLCAGHAERA